MGATDKLEQHKKDCPKCIETAPGQWDLCEIGQSLLREVPISESIKKALPSNDDRDV
jgi:hypothetical protein